MLLIISLVMATMVVAATIGLGVYVRKNGFVPGIEKFKSAFAVNLAFFIPAVILGIVAVVPEAVAAAEGGADAASIGAGLALLGAGLSTGLASIGAGIATGNVGSAAIGAISEDPKMFGKSMIFVGLSEGIAIYGILITILIFGNAGF